MTPAKPARVDTDVEACEFDRLLMRLLIVKDWLLRGAKPIGEDTRLAAAADMDLAHKLIARLHDERDALQADAARLRNALQIAQNALREINFPAHSPLQNAPSAIAWNALGAIDEAMSHDR